MLKITKPAVIFLLLFVHSIVYSQDKTIDSLKITLQNPKVHDTIKLQSIIITMSTKYNEHDKEYNYLNRLMGRMAWEYLQKDSSPEVRKKYIQYLASYYDTSATEYGNKKDVINALAAADKSIALLKSVKLYDDMYYAVISKGALYARINEYDKAISHLFAALKYYEKRPKKLGEIGLVMAQSNLASIYSKQKKYEKAIAYYKKVAGYYLSQTTSYTQNDYGLCVTYLSCGSNYRSLKKYDEALDYLNKGLLLAKKTQNSFTTSVALSKIAQVKMDQQKFDEAELILKQALTGDINELAAANAYVILGKLYYLKKDFKNAAFYLNKGLPLSIKNKDLDLQEMASEFLFKVSKETKNFKKALEMNEFQQKLADSSKAETSKNILAQQELRYNFENKELHYKFTTEKEKAAKNNWLIALSSAMLLILLGGYFYYRNIRQKQAITILEKNQIKQKLLVTQMNPHFIFNLIENIRSLIFQNQNNDAVNYLGKFSKLTRQILENSNENYISLEEEVEMIENYLSIQQLLYNNKFDFNISVEEKIDTESIFLPPMLTQPFIENAIKHGLSDTTQNGVVDIHFYLKETKLFFEVSDNGKGFDNNHKNANHKSLAMTITKERLVTYTKNQDFVVETANIIGENENVIGAKVLFEIPYIYES